MALCEMGLNLESLASVVKELRRESPPSSSTETIEGEIKCCSSGRGRIVLGSQDGTVSLLDRGLQLQYSFPAHSSTVLFLQQLKQRNFVVTVGEDKQMSAQQSAMCLKVFYLDKRQEEGSSSASSLECVQILGYLPINSLKQRSNLNV